MTLAASDLCFSSIFEDIGDYVPSTTKTPRDKERERYRERERDRERDRERERDRDREREREEEKKRHSYFEKPKVDDEVRDGPGTKWWSCPSLCLPRQIQDSFVT